MSISITPLRGTVGAVVTAGSYAALRSAILSTLYAVPDCPDSPEPGRACMACEAQALATALVPDRGDPR